MGVAREEDAGLYVITNSRSNRGASAVCCPGVLGEASELLGGDFYLLPSSIHEMIAVPAQLAGSGERLGGMVREINRTVLSEEEFLADTVYFYRAAEGRLVCAGAS